MHWSDVFTLLVVIFAMMFLCGLLARFFRRRICRPRSWEGPAPSTWDFSCCGGRPDRRGKREMESSPSRESEKPMAGGDR